MSYLDGFVCFCLTYISVQQTINKRRLTDAIMSIRETCGLPLSSIIGNCGDVWGGKTIHKNQLIMKNV